MNQYEMVALIVIAVMIAGIFRARYRSASNDRSRADDPETIRLREEIQALRDRVAVLERIATDEASSLEREIDRLRDS